MLCGEDGRDVTVYIQSDTQIGSTSLQQEQNGNSTAKMCEGSEMELYQRWKEILKDHDTQIRITKESQFSHERTDARWQSPVANLNTFTQ